MKKVNSNYGSHHLKEKTMSRAVRSTEAMNCRPTKKMLKLRLKETKQTMEDFLNLTRKVDMNWESRQAIVGQLYLEMRDFKLQIKDFKKESKNGKRK